MENIVEQIEGQQAVWEKHFSMNNWTLVHNHFELKGYRGRKYDGSVMDIYGWVEEISYGKEKGKYKAGHPTYYDKETDSDAVDLGIFDTVEQAKEAVINSNNPHYGISC